MRVGLTGGETAGGSSSSTCSFNSAVGRSEGCVDDGLFVVSRGVVRSMVAGDDVSSEAKGWRSSGRVVNGSGVPVRLSLSR